MICDNCYQEFIAELDAIVIENNEDGEQIGFIACPDCGFKNEVCAYDLALQEQTNVCYAHS